MIRCQGTLNCEGLYITILNKLNIQIIIVPWLTHARNKPNPDPDTHLSKVSMYIVLYIYSKPFPYGYMESDSPKRIGKRVTKIGFVVSGPEAMPCARMSRPMAMMGIRMTWRMMKMTKHGTC